MNEHDAKWGQYLLTFATTAFVHFLVLVSRGQQVARKTLMLTLTRLTVAGFAGAAVWSLVRTFAPTVREDFIVFVSVAVALLGTDYLTGLLQAAIEKRAGVNVVQPQAAAPSEAPKGDVNA